MADQKRAAHDSFLGLINGSDSDATSAWERDLAGDDSFGDDGDNQGDRDAGSRKASNSRRKAVEDATDDEDGFDPDEEEEDDQDTEDEDEDDSDADEEDEDEDDEDEDQSGDELDPKTKIKVKVDGEEQEVTLDELRNGYSRTAAWTRKTQELAEERKVVAQSKGELQTELASWRQAIAQVQTSLKSQLSGRSDQEWAQLHQSDPIAYYEAREQDRQLRDRLSAAQEADQQAQQEQQKHHQEQFQTAAREEADKLVSKLPEWTDKAVAAKEQAQIMEYGQELGFTEAELKGIVDHRAVLVLRAAAKFHALQAARSKGKGGDKVTKKRKPLGAGTPKNEPTRNTKARKSRQRLQRSGSIDDAANVFETFL